jgi:hypothetical protein
MAADNDGIGILSPTGHHGGQQYRPLMDIRIP